MLEDLTDSNSKLETEEENALRVYEEGPPEPPFCSNSINMGSRAMWLLLKSSKKQLTSEKISFLKKNLKEFKQGFRASNFEYEDDLETIIFLEIEHLENVDKRKPSKPYRPVKSFTEYLQHEKTEALAQGIKKVFAKETPTTLAVLVYTLSIELSLLTINRGEFKAFHKAMEIFFNGINIGRRQLYIKHNFEKMYKLEIENCKARIDKILKSIDKQ